MKLAHITARNQSVWDPVYLPRCDSKRSMDYNPNLNVKPFFWTHTHEISFWCSLTPTLARSGKYTGRQGAGIITHQEIEKEIESVNRLTGMGGMGFEPMNHCGPDLKSGGVGQLSYPPADSYTDSHDEVLSPAPLADLATLALNSIDRRLQKKLAPF